jgi:molecular chaperone GrpE
MATIPPDETKKSGGAQTATGQDAKPQEAAKGARDAQPGDAAQAAIPPEQMVAALRAEAAELKDKLLRALAEVENIRKRSEREKEETAKYAISNLARDIISVGDNFQRAIDAVPPEAAEKDPALKSFLEGVTMTERELLNMLERHGIRRIQTKQEVFDPNLHQAVMEIQRTDVPAGTIVQVFQPGYMIEDRVLRPAVVAVAKGGPKPASAAQASAPANENIPPGKSS